MLILIVFPTMTSALAMECVNERQHRQHMNASVGAEATLKSVIAVTCLTFILMQYASILQLAL